MTEGAEAASSAQVRVKPRSATLQLLVLGQGIYPLCPGFSARLGKLLETQPLGAYKEILLGISMVMYVNYWHGVGIQQLFISSPSPLGPRIVLINKFVSSHN